MRVLEFVSQETSLRSRRLSIQRFPFNLKVALFVSRRNIWNVISFYCIFSFCLASMSFIHTISIIDSACIVIFQVVLCRQCFIAQWFNKESHNLYSHTCKYEQYKKKHWYTSVRFCILFRYYSYTKHLAHVLSSVFRKCGIYTLMDIEDTFKHLN